MIWLKILKKIIGILQSEISPSQIAWGAALGAVLGLAPFSSLYTYIVFVMILVLNVNIGAAFLSAAFFGMVGFFTDPLADWIGYAVLSQMSFLYPVWAKLYNMPVVPFTRFNNTVVMGNFLISLALIVPTFLGTRWFVHYYRDHWREKVNTWKIVQLLKLSSAYSIYDKMK